MRFEVPKRRHFTYCFAEASAGLRGGRKQVENRRRIESIGLGRVFTEAHSYLRPIASF